MSSFGLALLLAILCVLLFWLIRDADQHELRGPIRRLFGAGSLILVLAIIVFLPVTSGGEEQLKEPGKIGFPLLLVGHGIMLAFLIVWWLLRRGDAPNGFLHVSLQGIGEQIRFGALAGVIAWVVTVTTTSTAVLIALGTGVISEPETPPPVMVWLADLPWLQKLTIIVAAMTAEEAFFRGFLQPRFGLLASSVFFAIAHFSYGLPFLVIGVFAFSLVAGYTFARRGQLLPCVIAHGVFDTIQLVIVLPLVVRGWPGGSFA